jgi:uncharacterized cysteine cluster protein YcgN (CxxCxxCC family)
MKAAHRPFWKYKTLTEMLPHEWEALCDGCGVCCLEREENRTTGRYREFSVCCEYLDLETCRCTIYPERTTVNPHCLPLTIEAVSRRVWLPKTCAYRRIAEGKGLEWWHPLVSGKADTVHEAGISIRDRAVSGRYVHPKDLP